MKFEKDIHNLIKLRLKNLKLVDIDRLKMFIECILNSNSFKIIEDGVRQCYLDEDGENVTLIFKIEGRIKDCPSFSVANGEAIHATRINNGPLVTGIDDDYLLRFKIVLSDIEENVKRMIHLRRSDSIVNKFKL